MVVNSEHGMECECRQSVSSINISVTTETWVARELGACQTYAADCYSIKSPREVHLKKKRALRNREIHLKKKRALWNREVHLKKKRALRNREVHLKKKRALE
ncbi:unnamed protein product [Boreogadus saida]